VHANSRAKPPERSGTLRLLPPEAGRAARPQPENVNSASASCPSVAQPRLLLPVRHATPMHKSISELLFDRNTFYPCIQGLLRPVFLVIVTPIWCDFLRVLIPMFLCGRFHHAFGRGAAPGRVPPGDRWRPNGAVSDSCWCIRAAVSL